MLTKDQAQAVDKMMFNLGKHHSDELIIVPNFELVLFDKYGKEKDRREVHNTVTTAGRSGVANQIIAAPTLPKMGWMAVGTGTPTATLLGAEIARVVFDSKTVLTNVVTVVCTFPPGTGTGALTEAGTFDVVTANTVNMWMSTSFAVVNKGAADSIAITWTLTIN